MKVFLLLFTFSLFSLMSWAQSQTNGTKNVKNVTVEWENLPGARSYDLELTKIPVIENEKPLLVKSAAPVWTGSLSPGNYQMRIRARDRRKAPGQWSTPQEFTVGLDQVALIHPSKNEDKKTKSHLDEEVKFQWTPVTGALEYQFELSSQDQAFTLGLLLSETQVSLKLPVAQKYIWKVQAKGSGNNSNDLPSIGHFTLLGKKLDSPTVNETTTIGGVMWEKPEKAETFDYILLKKNPQTGKWERLETAKDTKAEGIEFKKDWVDGNYALALQAKAPLRESSDRTESRFTIQDSNANRKLATTNTISTVVIKEDFEKVQKGYVFVQQLLTQMNYESTNTDASGKGSFSGVGGSFRMGAGYFWNDTSAVEVASESGGIFEGSSRYAFSGQEINYVQRMNSASEEERQYFGLFSKELPMVSAVGTNPYEINSVSAGGFHYGYEKNYHLSSHFGFQWNVHPFVNFLKIRTPNEEDLSTTVSVKAGLLGSYKFSSVLKGFAGYTYRLESMAYRTSGNNSRDNTVDMEGHFLNLYLEWDL